MCYTIYVMRKFLPLILDTLAAVALAIWLGSLVTLLTAFRPGAFDLPGVSGANSSFISLRVLNGVAGIIEGSGFVLIGVQFILRRRYLSNRELYVMDGFRQLFTFAALFIAFYIRINILNKINLLKMPNLEAHHHTIQVLFVIQTVLLVLATAITTWLQMPRMLLPPVENGPPNVPDGNSPQNVQRSGQQSKNKSRQQRRPSR